MDKSKMRQQMNVLRSKQLNQRSLQTTQLRTVSSPKPVIRNKIVELPAPTPKKTETTAPVAKATVAKTNITKQVNVGGCGGCARKLKNR